jgi:hypothetical protein
MPTLEITTKLGCSLACRFCPQDRLVKSYPRDAARLLSLDDFKHVLNKLPAHVRVDFSGMAEPWLNPAATAMAVLAFERARKVAIYTTLQGMPAADAAMLIERFAGRITPETPWVIHLPDQQGNMTGWKPSPAYLDTLARFVALRRDRAPDGLMLMTMSPDGAVHDALRPVLPGTLDPFVAISRVENLDRGDFSPGALLRQVRHEGALMCGSTPFFDHNTMLPNGDVVLCCMDYAREHVLGNLLRQDYADLFAGPEMAAVRGQAMGLIGGELICRRCHNAVCLSQEGGTHWRPQGDAAWTRREIAQPAIPDAVPAPVGMPRQGPVMSAGLTGLLGWMARRRDQDERRGRGSDHR